MSGETNLIIDDEESVRKSLADVMRDEGYDVVTAALSREGIDLLGGTQPPLALLDIAMPEMVG
jgi:two-component system nitrogen regulation response regulator NtrX